MAPLKPADIFVIQSAIAQYRRKYPRRPTPSAEVALAWLMERRQKKRRLRRPLAGAGAMAARMLDNVRFLIRPLGSESR
jgi:hypothetical protein